MQDIFEKIKDFIKKIKYSMSREACYEEMERLGFVYTYKKCHGLVGGDKGTEYLQYQCVDCPYFDGWK